MYIMASTGIPRLKAPIPARPKAPLLVQEGRRTSAGSGYPPIQEAARYRGDPPPAAAAPITLFSLAHRQACCQGKNGPVSYR